MLMRFDPTRELDRLVDQLAGGTRPSMPMDAYRHGDRFVLHFDVPGVDPDSIDVSVERNLLSVRAERSWQPVEGDEVIATERRHGSYRRQLFLSDRVDADAIHASYEHGVLTVTIPIAERAKARRVTVHSGDRHPDAIEATAT